jgi:aldose 1-epimerase
MAVLFFATPVFAAAVERRGYGTTKDGEKVEAFTLTSSTGASATIVTYGATVTELKVPDKNGAMGDVVLGFDNLQQYEKESPYFGCVVGRVGNRIAKGKFTLEGKEYVLATNNGANHLHGGMRGYDKRVWTAEVVKGPDPAVRLTLVDPDGTEGYPGTVKAMVTYTLAGNTLRIEYEATTDKATPINLTNHSYINLLDAGKSNILGHELQVNADAYTSVDATLIPTGKIEPVKGTPIDFRKVKAIGKDLAAMGWTPVGYDHNLVLRGQEGKLSQAAVVEEPVTRRRMELWTTQPGVQFYTGNFLDGKVTGKNGAVYKQHHGFCVETQHYPDSVNRPNFPSTILRPGATYRQVTEFRFSVAK